jgi:hypothetical protein
MRRIVVLVLLAGGCRDSVIRDARWEHRASQLAGQWELAVEFSPHGAGEPTPPSARGAMTLLPNRAVNAPRGAIGVPTNYGTYIADLPALGFNPSGNRVPAVFAGFTAEDSVEITFETDRPGFLMRMRGVLTTDTVRGTWYALQYRSTVGAGRFTMTRPTG